MTSVLETIAVPREWDLVPFGRVVERSRESGRPDLPPLSVFLDAGVVPRSSREDNHNRLGSDLAKYLVVRPGDIVFNKLRTWQGGVGASRYTGVVSPAYFVCRPLPRVNPRFLHYLLRSAPYLAELTRVSKFMPPSQFDILWDDLRIVPVLIPETYIQKDIARHLGVETTRIDTLISKKRRMIDLLTKRRYAVITGAIRSSQERLGGGRPLRAYADVHLGRQRSPRHATGPHMTAYLRAANVTDGILDLSDVKSMNFEPAEQDQFALRKGDILVSEGSGSLSAVGASAVWNGEITGTVCFQNTLLRLRPRSSMDPTFLAWWCRYAHADGLFARVATGANIYHISAERVRSLPMTHRPLAEQQAIADYLDIETGRIDALISKTHRVIDLLAERRQAVITAAVTGELVVPGVAA